MAKETSRRGRRSGTKAPVKEGLPKEGERALLGELLVQRDLIDPNKLKEVLVQQQASGKRLGTLLVELGAIDERSLAHVLADQLGIPVADLRRQTPEAEALNKIPESLARGLIAIPLRATDGFIEVAVADPNTEVQNQLTKASGLEVRLAIAPASDIRRAIDNSYRVLSGIQEHVDDFQATVSRMPAQVEQVAEAEAAPVVEVANLLITQALRDRASDIHIEPQESRVRIRFRIDGALHDTVALPEAMGPALVSRIKIMAGMNIVERRRPQDGQIATEIDGRALDIRVATTATIWGEKAVLRLLDKSQPLFRLEDIGMPREVQDTYMNLIRSPFGMVICAGPTGSGKTTTLYASLVEIQDVERNVMTIEDPVEYIIPSINQIQINEQAGVTFAGGLKAILRQDPDVILVGEVRDVDTARIAVQSALTGHLVLSSLHATDSVSALYRFLDMGIEPFLIASSVTGIVAQRLVRRICLNCKAPYTPTPEEEAFFAAQGGSTKRKFMHGEGCNFCSQTGYQDRIGVFELLPITDPMKQLIVRHASQQKLMDQAVKEGLRPLGSEVVRLAAEGVTTIAEVIRTLYTV
jgi:type IV pilus assembly protein PilB